MIKVYFLTFAAPLNIYSGALNRIVSQAKKFNMFYEIIVENEITLMNNHKEFWEKHGDFIRKNPRGFGYWIWKSYLINNLLKRINKNDIILYCDVGCELNVNGKINFYKLLDITTKKKISGFSAGSNDIYFTKRDLSLEFNLNMNLLKINHLQAGCLLIQKCELTEKIISEWYLNCEIYNNIDDSPSKAQNYERFVEHRHDQSVLNMVLKKYKAIAHYYGDIFSSEKNFVTSPILYIRNKTGKSVLNV
jgi:hypothetical protein